MLSRPGLEQVRAYRDHVDQAMLEFLSGERALPAVDALIELGLHHEQQHQELILTDIKHLLSRNPLKPAYQEQWPLTAIHALRAALDFLRSGFARDWLLRPRFLLRQRDAAPPRLA
jgi:hypothetical protein